MNHIEVSTPGHVFDDEECHSKGVSWLRKTACERLLNFKKLVKLYKSHHHNPENKSSC